jgi:demethylmenaquinone methyltransferase / 2-methoxy-6-polyprenyl-1,4-benzoquinol methylase
MSNAPNHPSSNPTPPAWSSSELNVNPHTNVQKATKVRSMFAAIAKSYDLNNRLHSFWLDQSWRKFAVKYAKVKPTDHILDVACGTGDLTRLFKQATPPPASVIGLDFTAEMLDIARTKKFGPDSSIKYVQGDAQALPYPDNSFDILSIAFGLRNVQDPKAALAEFYRVLKPGGRLIVLEFDRPSNPIIRLGNDIYTQKIMPVTATLISQDKSGAYKYLPTSVEKFLTRFQIGDICAELGFKDVSFASLTFGVCICHRSTKP